MPRKSIAGLKSSSRTSRAIILILVSSGAQQFTIQVQGFGGLPMSSAKISKSVPMRMQKRLETKDLVCMEQAVWNTGLQVHSASTIIKIALRRLGRAPGPGAAVVHACFSGKARSLWSLPHSLRQSLKVRTELSNSLAQSLAAHDLF